MHVPEHELIAERIVEAQTPSPIEAAREYVRSVVQLPALTSKLSEKTKFKVRHSDTWLNHFKRVGDLLVYLRRFDKSHDDPVYREMKACGLLTFEDIVSDFEVRFGHWSNDCSRISDFVIGEQYSTFDILILARNYDTRSGGMFVLKANGKPIAVVIKATLSGGDYPNEWIESPLKLKYYLKSIRGKFNEDYEANKAIIGNPDIPIVTFVRDSSASHFAFRGLFRYQKLVSEEDGAKAFILARDHPAYAENLFYSIDVSNDLSKSVHRSAALTRTDRLARLRIAARKPRKFLVLSAAYDRNSDVIAEVLYRAAGVCESCGNPAPFVRRSDGSPYLEVHHRIPLSMDGDDTTENALALCPNCHREQHFGMALHSESRSVDDAVDPVVLLDEKIS
jgi:5-methylcytosine-specific restriction protein A